MADLRISSASPTPPSQAPAPGAAARDAQRAFFAAALGRAGVATPAAPAASAAPPGASASVPAPAQGAAAASRPSRPGSLLDIRV